MEREIFFAPRAARDLKEIFEFISVDDKAAARRVIGRIERTIGLLLHRPFLGPAVLAPKRAGLRKITVAPYVVFYRVLETELQIVRILHSSRDLEDDRLFVI